MVIKLRNKYFLTDMKIEGSSPFFGNMLVFKIGSREVNMEKWLL